MGTFPCWSVTLILSGFRYFSRDFALQVGLTGYFYVVEIVVKSVLFQKASYKDPPQLEMLFCMLGIGMKRWK